MSEDDDNFEMHSPSKGEPGYRKQVEISQYAYERDLARRERDEAIAERDRFATQAINIMAQHDRLKRATKALCEAYSACNGEDDDAWVTARLLCMDGIPQ